MTASWIIYATVAGILVSIAAVAVERFAVLVRAPRRWIWLGALLLAAGLTVAFPFGSRPQSISAAALGGGMAAVLQPAPAIGQIALLRASLVRAENATLSFIALPLLKGPLASTTALRLAGFGWLVGTLAAFLVAIAVQERFRRARRTWPVVDLHGVRVRVAPALGPAVVGVVRPEIVVPGWLLDRRPDEQQLVLAHEGEHLRARDTQLLTMAYAIMLALPWSVALWFILARLRLATEFDCDARVLRRRVDPNAYGTLLVDVAERGAPMLAIMPALAYGPSNLQRRILAMQPMTRRFRTLRASAAGALGLALIVVACEARMPTQADVDHMNATRAAAGAHALGMTSGSRAVVYRVNGAVVAEGTARAILPDSIESIEVVRARGTQESHINIVTKTYALYERRAGREPVPAGQPGVESTQLARGLTTVVHVDSALSQPGTTDIQKPALYVGETITALPTALKLDPGAFKGLLYIDGVRSNLDALRTLDRSSIEHVEVIKGPGALAYGGAEAANGVITITTNREKQK